MFHTALVPLDGSELSEAILPYVSQLARGLEIPLVLLTVVDRHAIEHLAELRSDGPEVAAENRERVEDAARNRLNGIASRLKAEGLQVRSALVVGHPAEEIVRSAEQDGCDLIAMSTHGRTALSRGILGSVTDKVIHSSHVPTLTITPERAKRYWHAGDTISSMMVLLDGSALAERSLPYVEHLAQKMSLDVILVRVAYLASAHSPYSAALLASESIDLDATVATRAGAYLEQVAGGLRVRGLKVTTKVLTGHPAQAVVEFAHQTPHDIVALTTHGRTGVRRWVMGSVAEAVERASGDPVLVIPPDPVAGRREQT